MKKIITKQIFQVFSILFVFAGQSLFSQTYDGYTLYGKMGNNTVYLIDMNKATYHTWTNSYPTGYSVYLLSNQHIVRAAQNPNNQLPGAAMCGMVQDIDWNGTVTWQYVYSTSSYCTHHDIHPMPNGNVLLIAYEVKTAAQVTAAGGTQSIVMWPDKIVEVQPSGSNSGTIVWEWHVWDHLVQDHDASKSNYGVVADHPELLNINYQQQKDWMHTNGIDYNPDLDQIVFSSHNLNEIYVIDHSTTSAQAASHSGGNSGKGGDILYRWGNPAAYNQGTSANQVFHVVHDAHWIPSGYPWANRIVAFNNQGAPGNHSSVDMINPPYNGYTYTYSGGAYTPSTYNWRHVCFGNAQDQSSSQKLPNGNLLVDIASTGYIYEIDSLQNLLWSATVGGTVAKAFRYSSCYVNGGATVTATANPDKVCTGTAVQLNAAVTGGSGYTFAWTSDPPGFISSLQNPLAYPAVSTTYIVNISENGCSAADSVYVTANPVPETPVITVSHDTLFSISSAGNQWYLDSNPLQGATGNFYVVTQTGSYQLTVTDANNCTSALSDPVVWVGIGETTQPAGSKITVYPNPSSGKVNISWNSEIYPEFNVSVFDLFGKVLISPVTASQIDLSALVNGMYCLMMRSGNTLISCRKIVLHK
jgi:hypothetical protein